MVCALRTDFKLKKDQLSWALRQVVRHRPDRDGPGGLGAEESGTERTGPTHILVFAIQRGSRWAEVWRHYDSANDRVTQCFQALAARDRSPGAPTNSRPPAFHGGTRRQPPLAAMRGWRDHVRHDAGREPPRAHVEPALEKQDDALR